MAIKKKIFLSVAVLYLLSSTIAYAEMDVQLNLGGPAYIVAPAPVYVSPYPNYYDPKHKRGDFTYWQRYRTQERSNNEGHEEHSHEGREHKE